MTADLRFIWNANDLSPRENQMVGVLLELFMMNVILQRQMEESRTKAMPADASYAIRLTVEWARKRFPDLCVTHSQLS